MAVRIFGIATFLLFAVNCSTTEPPPPPDGDNPEITLELDDATCTEAWIKLTTTNLPTEGGPPTILLLYQNDITQDTINLSSADTLLYIDSLLPNTIYTFEASWQEVRSQMLEVKTPDATSHEINWEVETIGEPGSYALDVAIINENDIWVVGKFYKSGTDTAFNAAQWDGSNWNIVYIPVKAYGGYFSRSPVRAIHIVENEIWVFGESGGYSRYKDGEWKTAYVAQTQGTVNKIWGSSPDNLYFVGSNGSITKFNGVSFTLMNSNTDINLTDIYGTPDGSEVWACGRADGQRSIILRLNGNEWDRVWERNVFNTEYIYNSSSIKTIWLDNSFFAWFTGAAVGVYRQSYKYNSIMNHIPFNNQNAIHNIRGTSANNIFIVGDDAMVWHFNGITWNFYPSLNREENTLYSLDLTNDLVAAVGVSSSTLLIKALIIRGRR